MLKFLNNIPFNGRHTHAAIAANDDPWQFKIKEGRSFVGSGEDVPFNMEQLKPFNSIGEHENVHNL